MAITTREDLTRAAEDDGEMRLGPNVELDGKLRFTGTVRIDATFRGSIVTDDVVIVGERARIEASITCGTAVVNGAVTGNIDATDAVEVNATGRVRGDVETPALTVERGAVVEGLLTITGGAGGGSARRAASAGAPALAP
jgi:cytoskeletal protein CcmA (bactofilin family)